MTKLKNKSVTYWKQAENGLLAHVYEHIASTYISDTLIKNGLYYIADFDHWARTYGTVLYLDYSLQSAKASRVLKKAFSDFKKTSLSHDQVLRAAQQVAIEYERPLVAFENSFVETVQALHALNWLDISKLSAFQAEEKTSVNTVFSTEGIRYGRYTPKSFLQHTLHFEIDEDLYANNPALKAMAVLLIQTIALNLHKYLEASYVYYDTGDEWNNGAKTVAYRTDLMFAKKAAPTVNDLETKCNEYLSILKKNSLSRDLQKLVSKQYIDERARYFSLESMNTITDGIIIGYKGWQSVARKDLIQHLLENTKVKVISN